MYLGGMGAPRCRRLAAVLWTTLIVLSTPVGTRAADELISGTDDYSIHPNAESAWEGWSDKGNAFLSEPPGPLVFTVD
jgi:hypothetical protein